MIPHIDPRAMASAMKKLGIKQTDIPAKEVIIRGEKEDIIIKNPTVTKIIMMEEETFQIMGEAYIQPVNKEQFTKDDIATVIQHTNCTEQDAINSLKDSKGDIAEAILRLQNNKSPI